MADTLPYYLGCPAWSNRDWIGTVLPAETNADDLLRAYSRRFNTVEGNTFFYALPPRANLERWMAETPDTFRFAPKFPKAISHERRLENADAETAQFYSILESLADGGKLGVSFLQLPPSFNANHLDTLKHFLKGLPRDFAVAVEARHISWYDKSENERRLDDLLEQCGCDKVIFDTRPLFAFAADDDSERRAMAKKPQTPVRKTCIGKHPLLRFVGKNDETKNQDFIREWAPVINKWILEGKKPYIFAHAGDDAFAPHVARALHRQLKKLNPMLPELDPFAAELTPPPVHSEQLDLF